jgi:hypothetical protein
VSQAVANYDLVDRSIFQGKMQQRVPFRYNSPEDQDSPLVIIRTVVKIRLKLWELYEGSKEYETVQWHTAEEY